jgi:protein-disulfide isomerase
MTQERGQRRWQVGAAIVAGALVVAIAVAVLGGGSTPTLRAGHPVPYAAAAQAPFAGVAESGTALGDARAPVTLTEFADLQCPFCAAFARDTLPALVRDEVRPGRLRIVFAPLTFIGPDSRRGAEMALAVGGQNRLWPFVSLFYANQRDENTGYVTDAFLAALADATVGVQPASALAARSSPAVRAGLAAAATEARALHVASTPAFALSRSGAPLLSFTPADLQASAFEARIDELAAGRPR